MMSIRIFFFSSVTLDAIIWAIESAVVFNPRGVMVKTLDCGIVVNEFGIQVAP